MVEERFAFFFLPTFDLSFVPFAFDFGVFLFCFLFFYSIPFCFTHNPQGWMSPQSPASLSPPLLHSATTKDKHKEQVRGTNFHQAVQDLCERGCKPALPGSRSQKRARQCFIISQTENKKTAYKQILKNFKYIF